MSFLCLVLLGACQAQPERILRLATTTSTYDSGLLQAILPDFEVQSGVRVDVIAVGTGQAIAMGEQGDADVLLVHDRAKEEAFVDDGHGTARYPVMHSDFVIVGASGDPAGILGMSLASEAFSRIASVESPFVSRGDDSGTHSRELSIWAEVGIEPDPTSGWYYSVGQGMGETLQFASERSAYTLSDRGTFLAMSDNLDDLVVLVGGESLAENPDASLVNPYSVIPVNPDVHPEVNAQVAMQFVEWIISLETQERIAVFGVDRFGQPLFYPDSDPWRAAHPWEETSLDWNTVIASGGQVGTPGWELLDIVLLTLRVSGIALAISAALGIPAGAWLGVSRFPGRRALVAVIYTGMGLPPVVVGLAVYMLLSRSGPLGALGLLFTPSAMVVAQVLIALPLVIGLVNATIESLDPELRLQLRALGASRWQEIAGLLGEARDGVIAAVAAGFGGIVSEVGAAMLAGGNIEGQTRVLSTAIVLETRRGSFALALALGGVLLSLSFAVSALLTRLQHKTVRTWN